MSARHSEWCKNFYIDMESGTPYPCDCGASVTFPTFGQPPMTAPTWEPVSQEVLGQLAKMATIGSNEHRITNELLAFRAAVRAYVAAAETWNTVEETKALRQLLAHIDTDRSASA